MGRHHVRTLLILAVSAGLASPAVAQVDDATYCRRHADLALRYTGGEGRLAADFTTIGAVDDCNRGNYAAGIAVLERKLRSNGFTLPKR